MLRRALLWFLGFAALSVVALALISQRSTITLLTSGIGGRASGMEEFSIGHGRIALEFYADTKSLRRWFVETLPHWLEMPGVSYRASAVGPRAYLVDVSVSLWSTALLLGGLSRRVVAPRPLPPRSSSRQATVPQVSLQPRGQHQRCLSGMWRTARRGVPSAVATNRRRPGHGATRGHDHRVRRSAILTSAPCGVAVHSVVPLGRCGVAGHRARPRPARGGMPPRRLPLPRPQALPGTEGVGAAGRTHRNVAIPCR